MNIFLRLKHWQLFLLTFGIPIFLEVIFVSLAILNHNGGHIHILFPLMMFIYVGSLGGWFYAVGANLNKKLPETVKMNVGRFKLFIFIPGIYVLFLIFLFMRVFSRFHVNGQNPFIFFIIIPIHLFSMFCILYCLYFNAKSLKAVELQRPVTFADYAGEFFLIWFFPVGVWFIQPRINKLFADISQE